MTAGYGGRECAEPPDPLDEETIDGIFTAVADSRRRLLVAYLADATDGTATIDELLDHTVDRLSRPRDRCRVALLHKDLPVLADAGLIDYDERSETVRYHGRPFPEELLAAAESVSSMDYRPSSSG